MIPGSTIGIEWKPFYNNKVNNNIMLLTCTFVAVPVDLYWQFSILFL